MDKSTPLVKTVLNKVGVKSAESSRHNVARVAILITIVILVALSIYNENTDEVTIDQIDNIAKPGTILYQSIQELDDEAKTCYIRSLKDMTQNQTGSNMQKYFRGIKVSLVAGILSEYVVNGNTSKPLSIIFKTLMYSTIYTISTI